MQSQPTMRAITIDRYGGPEVLQYRDDVRRPCAGHGEVLVAVRCAGINFMDIHTRQGKYAASRTYPMELPCTLGMEGAGEVLEVGEGVHELHIGDRVAWCIVWGSFADCIVVPAARAIRIPPAIAYELAAATIFNGMTAHYLLHDVARIAPGMTCLVHAASGGIGQLLVQMATRMGATVMATASTVHKREKAIARGASHALDYAGGEFADTVLNLTGGRGVDVVFDAIGAPTLRHSFRATRTRGLVVNFGAVAGSLKDLDPIELGEAGSLFLTRPRLADHVADPQVLQQRANAVFGALTSGELSVDPPILCALEDVRAVHASIEARQNAGKHVACVTQST
jgi:NADPH2:quinone reductase